MFMLLLWAVRDFLRDNYLFIGMSLGRKPMCLLDWKPKWRFWEPRLTKFECGALFRPPCAREPRHPARFSCRIPIAVEALDSGSSKARERPWSPAVATVARVWAVATVRRCQETLHHKAGNVGQLNWITLNAFIVVLVPEQENSECNSAECKK